jgi:hypothetical protein
MDLKAVIQKQRIIDVNLFTDKILIYTGVCLKANKNIWILINYDYNKKKFNGFSVFRNNDIETFSTWKKNGLVLKKNNIKEFDTVLSLFKMNTFYSCLRYASTIGLIALFAETDTKSYYVGKIISMDINSLHIRLVNRVGKWSSLKRILISEIIFFSFFSDYEKKIENALGSK